MNKFSDTLIYLRKKHELSQQELADKLKMSRSIIGMYESNQRMPSFEMLESIADIFNVSIDFLVGHAPTSEESIIFRKTLKDMIENSDRLDLTAAGIDIYNVNLIIEGVLPLSFDDACQLSEQLGKSLDEMLGKTPSVNGNERLNEFLGLFNMLTDEQQSLVISQIKGILANQ